MADAEKSHRRNECEFGAAGGSISDCQTPGEYAVFNCRIAVALALLAVAGCADDVQPRSDFETLAAQTPWKMANDRETREFALPGGIEVSQERVGGQVHTLTIDQSGHGAVMCSWKIYSGVLLWVELCRPEETEWRANLSTALDRINDFIVANSLTPVSKQEVEAQLAKQLSPARERRDAISAQMLEKACRNNSDAGGMFGALKKRGDAQFQADVERLLSVPRPPVLNPCL